MEDRAIFKPEIRKGDRQIILYFKMSPQFCLGLQMDYDLDVAQDQLADHLDSEIRVYQPTA